MSLLGPSSYTVCIQFLSVLRATSSIFRNCFFSSSDICVPLEAKESCAGSSHGAEVTALAIGFKNLTPYRGEVEMTSILTYRNA